MEREFIRKLVAVAAILLTFQMLTSWFEVIHGQMLEDQLLGFAKHLQDTDEYYRAITEYERCLFLYPQSENAPEMKFNIGRCYLMGEQYSDAESCFRKLAMEQRGTVWESRSHLSLSETFYETRKYEYSLQLLDVIEADSLAPNKLKFLATYAKIWCNIRLKRDDQAVNLVESLFKYDPDFEKMERMKNDFRGLGRVKQKSATFAGILSSALPGAGQLYTGRKRDALAAFIWNFMFISGALYARQNNHIETATILGLIEISWYTANIYNSVNDAHKYNRKEWEKYLMTLSNSYGSAFSQL